jgi:putative ABC transport system permease protein
MIDKGAIIADITAVQNAFEMEDGAGELLGFFPDNHYNHEKALLIKSHFNQKYTVANDEFSPTMITIKEQAGMGEMMDYSSVIGSIFVVVFVFAMSVVLWNSGLLGGLRRYTEFGIRLALGENKNHIYFSLLTEGVMIGLIGSVIGTGVGLALSLYIQNVGIDISEMMKSSSLMMPSVLRTEVTPTAYYIGFIPGVFSIVLGNALAGIGIYKRKTSRLFNELEV